MIRWLRTAAASLVVLAVLALGAIVGLLLVENSGYVVVRSHPWLGPVLEPVIGNRQLEVQLPVLLAGWLAAVLAAGGLLAASMYYVWRRRQYESLITHLERELVRLRNLPLTDPAPMEDLPEDPDPEAARRLAAASGALPGEGEADDAAEAPAPLRPGARARLVPADLGTGPGAGQGPRRPGQEQS